MAPPVAIGTAQFGLDYGVTNREGKVTSEEVNQILEAARQRGIAWLDTAAAYGDAEKVVGDQALADAFRVCTKVGASGAISATALEAELGGSLQRLARSQVDVLLLHRPDALADGRCKETLAWAGREKDGGRIGAFGVSLYHPSELEFALQPGIDWVQLPVSILSQEWMSSGAIDRLRERGIRIQVRSLLAQGLLAVEPEQLPVGLDMIRTPLRRVHAAAEAAGLTGIDLALAFAAGLPVDLLVLGVQSVAQLKACSDALSVDLKLDWSQFAGDSEALDPRSWPAGLRI